MHNNNHNNINYHTPLRLLKGMASQRQMNKTLQRRLQSIMKQMTTNSTHIMMIIIKPPKPF